MTLKDFIALIVGVAAIYIGCTQKIFYSAARAGVVSNQRIPTWLGRLVFITAGSLFLIVVAMRLFMANR